jgi:hypothetical protein
MASILDSSSLAFPAMQKELSFFASCGWSPESADKGQYQFVHSCNLTDGSRFGMMHRYAGSGFYNAPWGPLMDENVMFPIAVYYACISSGDLNCLASLKPALDAMLTFLDSRGLNNTASRVIFTVPASGLADGLKHASN